MIKWETIENQACNTVGYSEAENKESFRVGACVGFGKAKDAYQSTIDELTRQLEYFKAQATTYETDLRTITRIINRYDYE